MKNETKITPELAAKILKALNNPKKGCFEGKVCGYQVTICRNSVTAWVTMDVQATDSMMITLSSDTIEDVMAQFGTFVEQELAQVVPVKAKRSHKKTVAQVVPVTEAALETLAEVSVLEPAAADLTERMDAVLVSLRPASEQEAPAAAAELVVYVPEIETATAVETLVEPVPEVVEVRDPTRRERRMKTVSMASLIEKATVKMAKALNVPYTPAVVEEPAAVVEVRTHDANGKKLTNRERTAIKRGAQRDARQAKKQTAKQAKASAPKVAAESTPRTGALGDVFGFSAVSVIRLLASRGFDKQAIRTAFDRVGVTPNPSTITIQMKRAGSLAALTADQVNTLTA